MQLRWLGPCWGQSGYEQLTRGLVIALDKLGVVIELEPAQNWNTELVEMDTEDRDRLQRMMSQKVAVNAIQVCHQKPALEYKDALKRVCYSLFETNRCPEAWLEDLNYMDRVWVFSEFNKTCWQATWIQSHMDHEKIHQIPFGVDTDQFHPDVKSPWVTNKKGFTFLSVGDFTERKNFEGLIEAFVTEFTDQDDVCLIIKAHYQGFARRWQDDVHQKFRAVVDRFNTKNPPRILFFGDKISVEDMPQFYALGDCFALASRGEGLGMPMIEAMASGLPVIATEWGAQADYMTPENSMAVACDVRVIDDAEYIKKCLIALNHKWAYPSVEDLRTRLRWMFEHQDEAKVMGAQGRKDMEAMTWEKAALAIIKQVQELMA